MRDANYTYIEISVQFGSDGVVIGEIVIPKTPSDTEPYKGQISNIETVRIPGINLSLVSQSFSCLSKGHLTVKL